MEGVRVFVRVRPPSEKEVVHNAGLAVITGDDMDTIVIEGKDHSVRCQYDGVFDDVSTQEDVFEMIKPTIAQVRR